MLKSIQQQINQPDKQLITTRLYNLLNTKPIQQQSDDSTLYNGSCHCKAITYKFYLTTSQHNITICNCSMCNKKQYRHIVVDPTQFELITGSLLDLSIYTFNTHQAIHTSCKYCNIHMFYVAKSDPNSIDINGYCVDNIDINKFKIHHFDGNNWDKAYSDSGELANFTNNNDNNNINHIISNNNTSTSNDNNQLLPIVSLHQFVNSINDTLSFDSSANDYKSHTVSIIKPISRSNNDAQYASNFDIKRIITRDISKRFTEALQMTKTTIDYDKAKLQHDNYVLNLQQIAKQHSNNAIEFIHISGTDEYADCCFTEDVCTVVYGYAIFANMNAATRQGEQYALKYLLSKQYKYNTLNIIEMNDKNAYFDGGDIMLTNKHLFVGLSKRTNIHALNQFKRIVQQYNILIDVIGINVIEGLHLKSVISVLDNDLLVVADNACGQHIINEINKVTNSTYKFILVPDMISSNVLRLYNTVVIQSAYCQSEYILRKACYERSLLVYAVDMSELVKADGALTCCSILC